MEDKWIFYNALNKNFLNTTRLRWSRTASIGLEGTIQNHELSRFFNLFKAEIISLSSFRDS